MTVGARALAQEGASVRTQHCLGDAAILLLVFAPVASAKKSVLRTSQQLCTHHADGLRSGYPDANRGPVHFENLDLDILADAKRLAWASRDHQHRSSSEALSARTLPLRAASRAPRVGHFSYRSRIRDFWLAPRARQTTLGTKVPARNSARFFCVPTHRHPCLRDRHETAKNVRNSAKTSENAVILG